MDADDRIAALEGVVEKQGRPVPPTSTRRTIP